LFFVRVVRVIDLFSDEFELVGTAPLQGAVKTGLVTHVTLAGIDCHLEDEAILVAIDEYLPDLLQVAALLTLLPQFVSGSAKVCSVAGLNGPVQGLAIHKSGHEDLAGIGILGYGRNQAIVIESWSELQAFFDVLFCSHLLGLLYLHFAELFIYQLANVNHTGYYPQKSDFFKANDPDAQRQRS